jgi:hypothetical protein
MTDRTALVWAVVGLIVAGVPLFGSPVNLR